MAYKPHSDIPERRVWINPGPLRNGVVSYHVHCGPQDLRVFTNYAAADGYRWWIVRRLYAQRRDAARAQQVTAAVTGQTPRS